MTKRTLNAVKNSTKLTRVGLISRGMRVLNVTTFGKESSMAYHNLVRKTLNRGSR